MSEENIIVAEDPAPEDPTLTAVKAALNIGGTYQDAAVALWIGEVKEFLANAGVAPEKMSNGLIARGVADLWNYGSGDGKLSAYFMQRAVQAALHS